MVFLPNKPLILASASPWRLQLLRQLHIVPQQVIPANIDEKNLKNERPDHLATRLSKAKARTIYGRKDAADAYILAADSVIAAGRRILGKPENANEERQFLFLLSGRRHTVYGGITIIAPDGRTLTRLCETTLKFKKLTIDEIDTYVASGEWEGKAG